MDVFSGDYVSAEQLAENPEFVTEDHMRNIRNHMEKIGCTEIKNIVRDVHPLPDGRYWVMLAATVA